MVGRYIVNTFVPTLHCRCERGERANSPFNVFFLEGSCFKMEELEGWMFFFLCAYTCWKMSS